MDKSLQLLKQFCKYYFAERDCERSLSLLTKDICWFGSSNHEDICGIKAAQVYIAKQIHIQPSPYNYTIYDEKTIPNSENSGTALLRIDFENKGVKVSTRITATSRLENTVERLCTMHFSLAQDKEKIEREKEELIISTLPGGMIGCYMEPGFPLFFINSPFLKHLGYANEDEYSRDINGLVINSVHPDDRDFVNSEIKRQSTVSTQYYVDYRFRKYDGSYIWVHEIGQKTVDENGKAVVICVNYDITEQHNKQVQMDNIVNAIPGGVALYRLVNNEMELLYQSKGVGKLTGRTEEDYAHLIQQSVCNSMYKDDAPKVIAAIQQAAASNTTVSLDYRVPHKNGGYIWINGSFRKTSMDGNCPIIHAVFSEMPQLRELLSDAVEHSSVAMIVTDAETRELLYINQKGLTLHHKDTSANYEGKLCYRYLMGYNEPCPFCHIDYSCDFQKQPRELYVPETGRIFISHGRLVDWAGRKAHIEYLTDITETKKLQQTISDMLAHITSGIIISKVNPTNKSHQILYMNNGFCQLMESSEAELRERFNENYAAGILPADKAKYVALIKRMTGPTDLYAEEIVRYAFPAGRYKWIHAYYSNVHEKDGSITTYGCFYDVTKQKQQEQKLVDSEKALDIAATAAGLWYWHYNSTTNQAHCCVKIQKDFDQPPTIDNFPKSWLDCGFVLPEYRQIYSDAALKMKYGEPQTKFEAKFKFKDGSIHWAELCFTNLPKADNQDRIAVCTARLIDLEKSLAAKYELEKQKPSLGEKELLLYAVFNLNTGKTLKYYKAQQKQSLVSLYPDIKQFITYVTPQVIGADAQKDFLELNSIDYLQKQLEQGNTTFSLEYRRKLYDGRIIWVKNILHLVTEPDTKNLLLFEYCYDIHNQKMSEEILRITREHDYEQISCVNFNRGTITYYGTASNFSFNTGLLYHDAVKKYANATMTSKEQNEFLKAASPEIIIKKVTKNGQYEFTANIKRKDGTLGLVRFLFIPYDEENKIYIMTRTDITELFHAEELKNQQLSEALSVAEQANKAKSNFLSSMSHDMRTPLNAVIGMCELAEANEKDARQVHESLSSIHSSSQLLLSLINNILDMSRIESGKFGLNDCPFSITKELKQTEESFLALAKRDGLNLKIQANIIHDSCYGDVSRLHSSIDNILSNAIKYTPKGGSIFYGITELPSDNSNIGYYQFKITDTGIGMDQETQKHMFDAFYRSPDVVNTKLEGTGLGLSVSKAIIDLNGGTISVKSDKGKGTSFTVVLPIHLESGKTGESHLKDQENKNHNINNYDLSQANILLCEDHPINQLVARRLLERAGASVKIAGDGQIGVDTFLQSPANTFNIILMDIRMPNMDGYQATKAIRCSTHPQAKSIPILAMTANAFADDIQKNMAAGMNDHLSKPITPVILYEKVLHYIGPTIRQDKTN